MPISSALRLAGLVAVGAGVVSGPALAASGDSDAFGYIVRGSDDGGNAYDYEIALIPMPLADDSFQTVSLPFTFSFYGSDHNSVEVHDNGGISFGLTRRLNFSHECGNLLGEIDAPAIFVHWADMAPQQAPSGAGIFYSTFGSAPNRRFVAEWDRMPIYDVGGTMSFQVKLFEADGRVELHYRDVKVDDGALNNGATAAVGITDSSTALLFSCDEAALSDPGTPEDEYVVTFFPPCDDVDGDDFCPPPGPDPEDVDCDDDDATRYPGAPELCDGLDNDCDGALPAGEQDVDGDEEMACEGDCDDGDASRHSGAEEVCNGVDDDCNDTLPPSERDVDGDGFSPCRGDCDDNSEAANPADADNDGVDSCSGDCDDDEALILPGAAEQCDGVDNDCNGTIDDNPNCGRPGGGGLQVDVPYGCLLACNAAETPGSGLWALALLPLAARRRRPSA